MFHPLPPREAHSRDVEIVVPVHGREAQLARCLASLDRCEPDGRRRHPLVVVDDGSENGAAIREVALGAGGRYVRREVRGGPGAARNSGLAETSSELVAFIDSDCVAPPGWIDRLVDNFADPLVGAAAPRIVALASPGAGLLASYEAVSSPLDLGTEPSLVRPGTRVPFVPAAALVARRSALGAGFDETLLVGEDVDLVWRIGEAGWDVRYDPAVEVAHEHRVRFGAWLQRRLDYGTSAAPLALRHPLSVAAVVFSPAPWRGPPGWLSLRACWQPALAGLRRRERAPRPPDGDASFQLPGGSRPRSWHVPSCRGGGRLAEGGRRGPGGRCSVPLAAMSRTCRRTVAAAAVARAATAIIGARTGADAGDQVRGERGEHLGQLVELVAIASLRLIDDGAYSVGVWLGCLRHRTVLLPLLPRRTTSPGRVGQLPFGG